MQAPPEECSVRNYLIDPYQIHYLRFIIEAYPGMAEYPLSTQRWDWSR